MFKNYLKMAWKVLNRRKFFTFISLFGISITLMILILATSLLENNLGKNKPVSQLDRMVFLSEVTLKKVDQDTVWTIDTSTVDGLIRYDSTFAIAESNSWTSQSSASYYLVEHYLRNLKSPVKMSMFCAETAFDVFYQGRKIVLRGNYTDGEYWEIFDFEFLEGKPYTQTQVDNQEQVVVISEQARDEYFGKGQPAVGMEMVVESRHYKVAGVVKGVASFKYFVAADIFIPYTLFQASAFTNQEILGPFKMVFLSEKPHQRAEISSEIKSLENKIVLSNSEYNIIRLDPMTYLEHASRLIFWRENQTEGLRILLLFISGVILLFILVPTLNLINLNISRIMERSSEIGVRKAFGATRYHLMYQFIFENILLTLLGGAFGLIMAIIMIKILNDSKIIPQAELTFNIRVFIYALIVSLTFGIISGFLPALKMSKMKIVDAIKNIKI